MATDGFVATPSGLFNRSVDLQRSSPAQHDDGENYQAWTTYATCRASLQPTAGKWLQLAQANASAAVEQSTIIIRYRAGVLVTDRIVYGTRTFRINAIANAWEANRELHITATEDLSP